MCEGNLFHVRNEFLKSSLSRNELHKNPFSQFGMWLKHAYNEEKEPTAFALSTCGSDLRVSSRILLLKEFSDEGFVFFSNYKSKKGAQMRCNNNASMLFFWPNIQRQVRIEGSVTKVSDELSDTYFNSRPLNSRMSAVASDQSAFVESRCVLQQKVDVLDVDGLRRPEYWGGYVLNPDYFEFWQGRENRLHDRFVYEKKAFGWGIVRIQP